jgi:hypothetical protein
MFPHLKTALQRVENPVAQINTLQEVYVLSQPVQRTVTCREWRYQRLHIYNYDVDLLNMSRAMLET